jgi:hypothetical protein
MAMLKASLCGKLGPCPKRSGSHCSLIPGACEMQRYSPEATKSREVQECCLCAHRKVCKYREEFEEKKSNTYIKFECKYFMD